MYFEELNIISYLTYFGASLITLAFFAKIYIVLTPYDEIKLIRQGQGAAAVALAGTLIGFSLSLAASAIYNNSLIVFVMWAVIAMFVQLIGYMVVVKVIGNVHEHITKNNMAVGGLIGLTGLVLGIINAGCLS